MKYGNCLFGAIFLAFKHKLKGHFVMLREKGKWIPHFGWMENNEIHDFIIEHMILPPPFMFLFFQGNYSWIRIEQVKLPIYILTLKGFKKIALKSEKELVEV